MNLEDILAVETCPVDEEIICGISKVSTFHSASSDLSIENWVHFLLFYRYLEKYCPTMGVSVSLSAINYCLSKNHKTVDAEKYVIGWNSGDFAKRLFTQVMAECDWQYRITEYNGQSWIRNPETGICKSADWKSMVKLARKMKKVLKLNRNDIKYHIFWNHHLAWYLQFRECNPRKVQLLFSEGDKKILKLLENINHPLCKGYEENFFMLDADKYLLGLIEGWCNRQKINFQLMNYLFLIRIIVLDKLLKCAQEIFGTQKEEKE